jgi:hypothetical protein
MVSNSTLNSILINLQNSSMHSPNKIKKGEFENSKSRVRELLE